MAESRSPDPSASVDLGAGATRIDDSETGPRFATDVFPREIAYIAKRQRAAGLEVLPRLVDIEEEVARRDRVGNPAQASPTHDSPNAQRLEPPARGTAETQTITNGKEQDSGMRPTVANGLVGLAFSGGGIRSATFNLGVLQALHRRGIFKHVDLLSTVSGGGFIGSCLTSLMSRPKGADGGSRDAFPFGGGTARETAAVVHLRNNSNYLAPRGGLDHLRMFAVLTRGIILNFLVVVPLLLVPSLIATIVYGPQLLSRLEYDETVARVLEHLAAADLADRTFSVEAGQRVQPLLVLLEQRGLIPLDVADTSVTAALRERNDSYRGIKKSLITGTGSRTAPYVFLPDITLSDVAHRLWDADLLEHPGKIDEIQAVELALDVLSLGSANQDARDIINRLTIKPDYLPNTNGDPSLFMMFVTKRTLEEVLIAKGMMEEKQGKASAPRYSLTQILQAFYDERLFDRRWLQAEMIGRGSTDDLQYRWHDDERTHLEVEAAARALWEELQGLPDVTRLFALPDVTPPDACRPGECPSLKPWGVKAEYERRKLLSALEVAGVVEAQKERCGIATLSECRFQDRYLTRLPAVLYAQGRYAEDWFVDWWLTEEEPGQVSKAPVSLERRQALLVACRDDTNVNDEHTEGTVSIGRITRWFASANELQYCDKARARTAREVSSARTKFEELLSRSPLEGGMSVEDLLRLLEETKDDEFPFMASTVGTERIMEALNEARLVEAATGGECVGELWDCTFVSNDSIDDISALLYARELYNRGWFEQLLGPDVEYQKTQTLLLTSIRRVIKNEVKRKGEATEVAILFTTLAEIPETLSAIPNEQTKEILDEAYADRLDEAYAKLRSQSLFDKQNCPAKYNLGDLDGCRWHIPRTRKTSGGDPLGRALEALNTEGFLHADISGARSASPFNRWYRRNVEGTFFWDPNRLYLPITLLAASLGLGLVLLFPVASLFFGWVAKDWIEQKFRLPMLFIAAVAFFELQPYLIYQWRYLDLGASWSAVLAAASLVSMIAAGPALSYFKKFGRTIAIAVVSALGPLLPFMIYLTVMSKIVYAEGWPTRDGYALDWVYVGLFFGLTLLVVHLVVLSIDPNSTGLHSFYKKQLSLAYLRDASTSDDLNLKLSETCPVGSAAPYQLINTALNLQGSDDPAVRDRRSDSFLFSKLFVGGGQRTGYCATREMEKVFPQIDLGSAMAVSGAAAAPNMGAFTVVPLVMLLALLNIRLGYWVPNPRHVRRWLRRRSSTARPPGHAAHDVERAGLETWRRIKSLPGGLLGRYPVRPGPYLFLRELVSRVHDRGNSVNVSDGGHFENTAIYELLRRRCTLIIAGDAEADPEMNFSGLATLERFAYIDLGIDIDINTDTIQPVRLPSSDVHDPSDPTRLWPSLERGPSQRHFAVGTIHYPKDGDVPKETGYLLYLKSSLTGDEKQVISEYSGRHSSFPHESTADQFFDEGQFESYRALGYHIADNIFGVLDAADAPTRAEAAVLSWIKDARRGPVPLSSRGELGADRSS